MARFQFVDGDDSDDDGVSSTADGASGELEYSDDDEEIENEPPHPLGFPGQRKKTSPCRYSVDPDPPESLERYMRRAGYSFPHMLLHRQSSNNNLWSEDYDPPVQEYPPLSSYIDPNTAPTQSLMRWARDQQLQSPDRDGDSSWYDKEVDSLHRMLERASLEPKPTPILSPATTDSIAEPFRQIRQDEDQIEKEMDKVRRMLREDNQKRVNGLKVILRREEEKASQIRKEQRRLDDQHQKQAEEQERVEEEQRRVEEKEREKEKLVQEKKQQELQRQREAGEKVAREKAEKDRAAGEAAAKEREHVARANKLVVQLVQLRASVEPFEKSTNPIVKKRRLQMKKLVNGKVNTLTENVDKIRSVAADVSQAISAAREEDERMKQLIAAGDPNVTPEMARGKRYLVDLLSSKVVVRVQAEGFNGQRGDGFPLANMLALVSVDNKDLIPVLQAHIYTVSPVAIPTLPSPAPDASEEELMESLGMLKKDDGTFETFERFLSRTESIISIVADIMSSMPPTHNLFGGNESAVKWLTRFLALLPPAPESPLPLLTAPVLDAFLTGAGHMLANKHADEFKAQLDTIMNDVIGRLDEGPIGAPSAIRLKKTVGDGFSSFQSKLPNRALSELYYGASGGSGGGGHHRHQSDAQQAFSSAAANPFAATGSSGPPPATSNPFGPGPGGANASSSPFGATGITGSSGPPPATSNPFGPGPGSANAGMAAETGPANYTGSSPFSSGSSSMPASNPSPFASAAAPTPSPFAQTGNAPATAPSNAAPFNAASNPFGGGNTLGTQTPSPFSQPGNIQPPNPGFGASPSPFSQPSNASNNAFSGGSSPFQNNPSPFGNTPSPSPFGNAFGAQPAGAAMSSPFGAPSSGFGQQQQQQGGRGGGGRGRGNNKKPPCKFFASGNCKFGNNCRFSHDTGASGGATNNATNNNTFGGGGGNTFGNSPW